MLFVKRTEQKIKSNLGANAILGVSMAAARAAAKGLNIPLYSIWEGSGEEGCRIPMMNILKAEYMPITR